MFVFSALLAVLVNTGSAGRTLFPSRCNRYMYKQKPVCEQKVVDVLLSYEICISELAFRMFGVKGL